MAHWGDLVASCVWGVEDSICDTCRLPIKSLKTSFLSLPKGTFLVSNKQNWGATDTKSALIIACIQHAGFKFIYTYSSI
jgi:hypothetical protein